MKLKAAFNIAKSCGLTTVGEAILNIDMHSMSIFVYDEISNELKELYDEYKKYEFNQDDLIEDVIDKVKAK